MQKNIFRKGLVIVIIVLFIGTQSTSALSNNLSTTNNGNDSKQKQIEIRDQIDQQQLNIYAWLIIGVATPYGAQSFTPSLNILTRVELNVNASDDGGNVDVAIRESLNGSNLTFVSIPQSQLPNPGWFIFDFPDIPVNPGNTYYIVVYYNIGYNFGWGYSRENDYLNGEAWLYEQGWYQNPNYVDFAFKTYGINDAPPNPPTITGPHYGKTNVMYNFSIGTITDPDADQIYCLWDWGDGNTSGWIGPYESGETIQASHIWIEPREYAIKVKLRDTYGTESNWSEPFKIQIVQIKAAFFIGTFQNLSETDDLWIILIKFFIVFPSNGIFYRWRIIAISKLSSFIYLGPNFAYGGGNIAIL